MLTVQPKLPLEKMASIIKMRFMDAVDLLSQKRFTSQRRQKTPHTHTQTSEHTGHTHSFTTALKPPTPTSSSFILSTNFSTLNSLKYLPSLPKFCVSNLFLLHLHPLYMSDEAGVVTFPISLPTCSPPSLPIRLYMSQIDWPLNP